jgi:hypothetical protein
MNIKHGPKIPGQVSIVVALSRCRGYSTLLRLLADLRSRKRGKPLDRPGELEVTTVLDCTEKIVGQRTEDVKERRVGSSDTENRRAGVSAVDVTSD